MDDNLFFFFYKKKRVRKLMRESIENNKSIYEFESESFPSCLLLRFLPQNGAHAHELCYSNKNSFNL